ncbi:YchJ family protein [Roseateles chitosanitabidus]|jgi:SEC-C motif-containing protein|uniref:YchJ family protein n=1 Tax=Roseateles chitosanitabidus TaxID=65048 RepID=UPI000830FDE3|nr:YchJ family metal-binding protein [Roseateles chitosanitabidus]MBO9688891.1 SEC-C domain-containing protein [Roseateles chitosanitabidus]
MKPEKSGAAANATACPCGSGRPYDACCGVLHRAFAESGTLAAPDAQALMRSRYSAYTLDLIDYLLATWHPSTRPESLERGQPDLRWLGLEVRRHERQDADHETVEFIARSKSGGRAQRMHEISRFVRERGAWLYVDGQID